MELLPGVHWIQGIVDPDYLKTNNISILFGDKPSSPSKFYKYVPFNVRDASMVKDIDKLVGCVSKLYAKNVLCAMSFDTNDVLQFFLARLLFTVCKVTDIDDIHDIIHTNYNINLSEKQRQRIGVNA